MRVKAIYPVTSCVAGWRDSQLRDMAKQANALGLNPSFFEFDSRCLYVIAAGKRWGLAAQELTHRIHRIMHPILGPATWSEIKKCRHEISKSIEGKICLWCHKVFEGRGYSCCGAQVCREGIHRIVNWKHCKDLAFAASQGCCVLCGDTALEIDHITQMALHGTDDAWNLRAVCRHCHVEISREFMHSRRLALKQC